MKKYLALLLALVMLLSLCACKVKEAEQPAPAEPEPAAEPAQPAEPAEEEPAEEPAEEPEQTDEGVMTYAEYVAADLDTEVTVDTYVQAKQSWWDNSATVYTEAEDGAYFLYGMACSEEDYEKLVPGTKIRVTGYKSEWAGEVEIVDATFEILEGSYIATPREATSLLADEDLISYQNQFASFSCMTVEPSTDADGNEVAFLYSWDGSGDHDSNSDLYFNVSVGGQTYQFTVESYLCDNTTDVYAAVEALQIGDKIDMEGFLYWYEGINPHITSVAPAAAVTKSEGVMTYAEYVAADLDSEVVIETYVQATQSWWDDKVTVYSQDGDGAYFLYNMACSEDDFTKLAPGAKIKVTGYKSEWAGEIEIVDATFEIEDGYFLAVASDVTDLLGTDDLAGRMNELVTFTGMTVEASKDADGNEVAFLYNWDGSGDHDSNSDLYFNVSFGGQTYHFTVESYLCDNSTDVYAAVEGLQIGDVIDMEGFLYWYEGVNPHITSVVVE